MQVMIVRIVEMQREHPLAVKLSTAAVGLCTGARLVDGGGFRHGSLCVKSIHCFFVSAQP